MKNQTDTATLGTTYVDGVTHVLSTIYTSNVGVLTGFILIKFSNFLKTFLIINIYKFSHPLKQIFFSSLYFFMNLILFCLKHSSFISYFFSISFYFFILKLLFFRLYNIVFNPYKIHDLL